MNDNSLSYCIATRQPIEWTLSGVGFRADGMVFCPMCDVWHENNTMCQMPWSGDHE